jgi:hypothetical protein
MLHLHSTDQDDGVNETIETEWQSYRAGPIQHMPEEITPVLRDVFFAGGVAMLRLLASGTPAETLGLEMLAYIAEVRDRFPVN